TCSKADEVPDGTPPNCSRGGQPNPPPFTGVPLKRELLKSEESIRVLRSANNPSPSYRARPVARLSREGLRELIELCSWLFLSEVCSSQRGILDVVISPTASLKSARGKDGYVAVGYPKNLLYAPYMYAKRALPLRHRRNRKGALVDLLFYS